MLRPIGRVASITSDHAHSLHIVMIIINTMVIIIIIINTMVMLIIIIM